jgi:MSHA pilin protein MshC
MKPRGANNKGFTLVELVTILIVTGVLAAFAIPRMMDRTGFASRGFYDQAQGAVRYAQKVAVAQRRQITLTISVGGISTSAIDPATGAALSLAAPSGVSLAPATSFTFDALGTPSFGSQLAISVNSTGVGDINRTFYVEATTGYVHP